MSPAAIRGDSLIGKREFAAADTAYRSVTATYPTDGRSWFKRGIIAYSLGRFGEAAESFGRAYDLPYDRLNAAYNAASAAARAGQTDEAFSWLAKAFTLGYADVGGVLRDKDLASLRADVRWSQLIANKSLADIREWPRPSARARDYWPTTQWQHASPARVGLDSARLAVGLDMIQGDFPDVSSFVLVRNGYIAAERYFHGHRAIDPVNVKSVTKSVMSSLVGIALDGGVFSSLDQPLANIAPTAFADTAAEAKRAITLRHLVTMTAGLQWAENADLNTQWNLSRNPAAFSLGLSLENAPGSTYKYSTATAHLMSVAIHAATKRRADAFAFERLFLPIGIHPHSWSIDAGGEINGGSELRITPQDMARFGSLYLNGGRWDGRQILPAEWVAASTRPQAPRPNEYEGYGYTWRPFNALGHPAFYALGFGGQYVVVLPDLDIVVVMTSHTNSAKSDLKSLVVGFVVPSVLAR